MMKNSTPQLIFQPDVYQKWQEGIDALVNAIRPTLGPMPRLVAIERTGQRGSSPALFDNGGQIARRLIQLDDRSADMGAMFLRHIIWRVHEEVGDGTATTAVLFQTIFSEGVRYITSGGNAMRLRGHLERGGQLVLNALAKQVQPVAGAQRLTQLAHSLHLDENMAQHLGEIFSLVGPYGRLEIRSGRSRHAEREYVTGSYWDGGILHQALLNKPQQQRAELSDVHLLLTDWEIETPQMLLPLLRLGQQEKLKSLVVVARKLGDSVVGLFRKANGDPNAFNIIGVQTPGSNVTTQAEALEDLSKLTGGAIFPEVIGTKLGPLQRCQLGRARRVWADKSYVGIIGGRGEPRALRTHVAELQRAYEGGLNAERQKRRLARLGRLLGGTAVLHVGAASEAELAVRQEAVERTARTLRGAAKTGVVPGGGVALLNCRQALVAQHAQATDTDERAACAILLKAIEAPIRAIAANAGHDPSEVLARIKYSSEGDGFDARTNEVVMVADAGLWDVAQVLETAVSNAVKGAALALTTDVLLQHRTPEEVAEP